MYVSLEGRKVGIGELVYIIAEIGINHNGSLDIAKKLIDVAVNAKCDAVKFQKRTPELCVPKEMWDVPRETPWGNMTYLEYRHRVEFDEQGYEEIINYCKEKKIHFFTSPWDIEALKFSEKLSPVCHKVASASVTDHALLKAIAETERPVILSTGMSSMEEIRKAVSFFDVSRLLIAHSTSIYPCPLDKLNLRMLSTLKEKFNAVIGYSGHEVGLSPSYVAVALGACFVERHITLDRSMWGSDQSASVEPHGLVQLVENIRNIEIVLGNGVKEVYPDEIIAMKRLRIAK